MNEFEILFVFVYVYEPRHKKMTFHIEIKCHTSKLRGYCHAMEVGWVRGGGGGVGVGLRSSRQR